MLALVLGSWSSAMADGGPITLRMDQRICVLARPSIVGHDVDPKVLAYAVDRTVRRQLQSWGWEQLDAAHSAPRVVISGLGSACHTEDLILEVYASPGSVRDSYRLTIHARSGAISAQHHIDRENAWRWGRQHYSTIDVVPKMDAAMMRKFTQRSLEVDAADLTGRVLRQLRLAEAQETE